MFGCRRNLAVPVAAVLMLALTTPAGGLAQPVPSTHVFRELHVGLAALAANLGIPVRHARGALEVRVDGSWLRVAPGDVTVTEDQAPMMRLSTFPVVRGGVLYVNASDIPSLLDVYAIERNGHLQVSKHPAAAADSGFEVKELPTPTPRPTAQPRREQAASAFQSAPEGKHIAGHANFEVNDQANSRYFQGSLDGGTPALHGTIYASGSAGSRTTLGGTVTFGPGAKHTSLGGIPDPLYGQLFISGAANGVELENSAGTILAWGGTPFDGRHVIAASRRTGKVNRIVAFASRGGAAQGLVGLQYSDTTDKAQFDREVWFGTRGLGAGLHYRTSGRLYTEERFGIATSAFPLIAGDAPRQANIGYDFSSTLGAKAGFASGLGYSARPFVVLYGRLHQMTFGLSHAAGQSTIAAGLSTRTLQTDLDYGRSVSGGFLDFTGRMSLPHGALEANAYLMSGSNRDAWVDYRLKREAPAFSIGLESVASGSDSRIGPVFGYSAPVGMSLAVGLELHPLVRGEGIRFSVHNTLFALDNRSKAHFVTVAADSRPQVPVYVLIDGARRQQLNAGSVKIAVPSGSHYVSIQSADALLASPETNVIDGTPDTLTLPLWAVVAVQGTLVLPAGASPAFAGPRPPLSGITVTVAPQNFSTQTDANGNFDFPAQALAPGSSISVDASSLPAGLSAPAALKIPAGGRVSITLQSSKKVQKIVF